MIEQICGICLLATSVFFAAVYDSHEGALNKIHHALEYFGLMVGMVITGWWGIVYYTVIRALFFDWIYYYYDDRPLNWRYWIKNNWIVKIFKNGK